MPGCSLFSVLGGEPFELFGCEVGRPFLALLVLGSAQWYQFVEVCSGEVAIDAEELLDPPGAQHGGDDELDAGHRYPVEVEALGGHTRATEGKYIRIGKPRKGMNFMNFMYLDIGLELMPPAVADDF
jgi:hypothetical protein